MELRYATESDFDWLQEEDCHINSDWVSRCISNNEYLICEYGSSRVGFLRYSLFWGEIPYMDMILVLEDHRYQGVGTALFQFWEAQMKDNGARILMTSSAQSEKEPQEWHHRNGFEESGRLTFGQLDPTPEIFLVKNL